MENFIKSFTISLLIIFLTLSSISCTNQREEEILTELEAEEKQYEQKLSNFMKKNNAIRFPDSDEYKYASEIQDKYTDKILYDEIVDFNEVIKIKNSYYGSCDDYLLKIPEEQYKILLKDDIEIEAIAFKINSGHFVTNIEAALNDYEITGKGEEAHIEHADLSTYVNTNDTCVFIGELIDIMYSEIIPYED